MKWKNLSDEIYEAESDIVSIGVEDISLLKKKVTTSKNNRVRICAHRTSQDNLHEMLIVIGQDSYIRPHKHLNKSESFHIIEGMLDVIIFDDDGKIIETIQMGDASSGKKFFYRLSASYFHTVILKTALVVFHETTSGPFLKENTICAPWSPEQKNREAVEKFIRDLKYRIQSI